MSSKQSTIADSTTEVEYIAATDAAKEAVWIKKSSLVPSIKNDIELYCHNNGVIAQSKEPRPHQRSKHMVDKFHLIRENVEREDVKESKVRTEDNIADLLTKPLAQPKYVCLTRSVGLKHMGERIQAVYFMFIIERH